MKTAGFIYALYIEGQFIEHFKTADDAKNFCKSGNVVGDQKVVVRPIVYFRHKEPSKKDV